MGNAFNIAPARPLVVGGSRQFARPATRGAKVGLAVMRVDPHRRRPFEKHLRRIRLSGMTARSFDDELEQLFDQSLNAVFIAGFDGFLRRVNRGFAHLLGYSHEEVLARPFIDNVHPDDVEAVRAALAELGAGNDLVGFECRQVTADGGCAGWSGT
jgi:PAS domain S-box-containing protein